MFASGTFSEVFPNVNFNIWVLLLGVFIAAVAGDQVGYASSGCWSPLLKKSLALAHLRSPHFEAGTPVDIEITVEHQRRRASALVRKLPFYDPERKKA